MSVIELRGVSKKYPLVKKANGLFATSSQSF